jgi:prepilin-type N-terminal cleavage/methylation domain-containing protein
MTTAARIARGDQSGFGLVELIVAVAILVIISLSLVPVLANGVKQSAANTTLATASQIANQMIELAAAQPTTCSTFNTYGILSSQTTVDPRGVTLVATNSVAACPTGFPSSRVFTTTVTRQDTGAVLVSASTRVYVSGS